MIARPPPAPFKPAGLHFKTVIESLRHRLQDEPVPTPRRVSDLTKFEPRFKQLLEGQERPRIERTAPTPGLGKLGEQR